jgi:hypothetical protein
MSSDEKFYLGWQVGITYEAEKPAGNSLPKMLALLDEMAANGMNILSLMMTSYAYFDPAHDGFAWPVAEQAPRVFSRQTVFKRERENGVCVPRD